MLTVTTDRQTDRQTGRPRYSVCRTGRIQLVQQFSLIIPMSMSVVLPLWHSHCKSSPVHLMNSDSSPGAWQPSHQANRLPSNRRYQSNGDCLEGKRENNQACSVQYCVQQLCTVQHTHMNTRNSSLDWVLSHWAHFTTLRFIFVYVCILCIIVYCTL